MTYTVWQWSYYTNNWKRVARGKATNGKHFTDKDREMFAFMLKTGSSVYTKQERDGTQTKWEYTRD